MRYLLCQYFQVTNDEKLHNRYIIFHRINEENYYFKVLFLWILTVPIEKNVTSVKKF